MKYLFFATLFLFLFSYDSNAHTLKEKTLLVSFTKAQIDSALLANNVPPFVFTTKYGIDAYKIHYYTEDYDSTEKVASGLMVVPHHIECPMAIINHSHGTTSVKEDVPSRLNGEALVGMVSASNGFVSALPDYLGMGDSDWPHYYLHKHTQAMAVIDLLRAVREACDELGVPLNDDLYLTGYSQGGYSSMAAHKYIETYFSDEFQVTRSFPGGGSYDMSGAMLDLMLSEVSYSQPGYLPFLIFTWNAVYNFFDDPSEYIRPPYDTILPGMVNGEYSIPQMNQVMPDTPIYMFHQHMIDTFTNNPDHPLRLALEENDVFRWVPQSPMLIIHCFSDNQVPVENAHNAYNYFIQNGAMNVDTLDLNPSASHGACGQASYIFLKSYMDSIIADDPCFTSVKEIGSGHSLNLYPNPAQDYLVIEFADEKQFEISNEPYHVRITDISGRTVKAFDDKELFTHSRQKIDLKTFIPGTYLLKIEGKDLNIAKRFVLIR